MLYYLKELTIRTQKLTLIRNYYSTKCDTWWGNYELEN